MKKIFSIILFLGALFYAQAQDIIITKDSKKIDAKITKVTKDEIEYKKTNNLDGPIFVIPINDINSIIYANGEIQLFETKNDITIPKAEKNINIINDDIDNNNEHLNQTTTENFSYISKVEDSYFIKGKQVNEKEYLNFIASECPIAYRYHQEGNKQCHKGLGFIIGGCISFPISATFYASGDRTHAIIYYSISAIWSIVGIVGLSVGIPIYCKGLKKKNNSYKIYNKECSNKLSLNLQSGINGCSIKLQF